MAAKFLIEPWLSRTKVTGRKNNHSAIKTVGLSKYFDKRVAVDNLNLVINQGEFYALLGDNGAGKTTTLNMLTTLLKPSSGEFYICGLNGISEGEEAKGVFGIVSQDVAIYHELTAYENLQFIASLYKLSTITAKTRIEELLVQSGLTDRAHDLVQTYSGGMQRKLAIAIALLHKPAVLFMDEPTVGLDPHSRRQIWSTLASLRNEGVTILLTTHYLQEAELLADRIGIIRQGKLVAEGTLQELQNAIHAVRSIEVRLDSCLPVDEIMRKIDQMQNDQRRKVNYDSLHNTIIFVQPEDNQQVTNLITWLEDVINCLKENNIPFVSFSSKEPNLEEVFLATIKKRTI